MTIASILVANRGEIACRVIRTVQALGLRAIAVYSEADAAAPHVAMADAAALIGPPPAADSYLDIANIVAAAAHTGADAVHPGYGFLAENPAFASACLEAGLTFIGPTPDAIELMGNKAEAKRRMIAAGVPCVPGYEGNDQSDAAFVAAARNIGYPIMVKAAAGGGGRGMRLVEKADELVDALRLARSEARNAFASDELILEKAIRRPRHVELQIVADQHGKVIHLGERDCSVQRRHQKVVEEAPCPVMTGALRERMGQAAVDAAKSIGYQGAGTVEFLLDEESEFFFLEMNTRLQVEHPVTELVTGVDLVAMQIRVANGEPLGIDQDDVTLSGHAIEVRLYAEDPAADFRPSSGTIDFWAGPSGDGVRVDTGIDTGFTVSPFYDPMLAKIIACGETRETARRRLVKALGRTVLFGPTTNRDFLIDVLGDEAFVAGVATTALIAESFDQARLSGLEPSFEHVAIAAVLDFRAASKSSRQKAVGVSAQLMNWSSRGKLVSHLSLGCGDRTYELAVTTNGGENYRVSGEDSACSVQVVADAADRAELLVNDHKTDATWCIARPGEIHVALQNRSATFSNRALLAGDEDAAGGGRITAPMHGQLQKVFVKPGDSVTDGSPLCVLEAMKMQHEIRARINGTVERVHFQAGDQVAAGAIMLEILPADAGG